MKFWITFVYILGMGSSDFVILSVWFIHVDKQYYNIMYYYTAYILYIFTINVFELERKWP